MNAQRREECYASNIFTSRIYYSSEYIYKLNKASRKKLK